MAVCAIAGGALYVADTNHSNALPRNAFAVRRDLATGVTTAVRTADSLTGVAADPTRRSGS